jgi:hypothetical protein
MVLALAAHAQPTEWRSYPFGSGVNTTGTDQQGDEGFGDVVGLCDKALSTIGMGGTSMTYGVTLRAGPGALGERELPHV